MYRYKENHSLSQGFFLGKIFKLLYDITINADTQNADII